MGNDRARRNVSGNYTILSMVTLDSGTHLLHLQGDRTLMLTRIVWAS